MKGKDQNGKSQFLHIYHLRNLCHFFTIVGLPVNIIRSQTQRRSTMEIFILLATSVFLFLFWFFGNLVVK